MNGGKILLIGGAPRSAGDDTDRLLTAVREAVGRLQAGISHGRVFTGDTGSPTRRTYSVKGDAVNLAARLAAHAESGTILMAADVLEHTRQSYDVNDAAMANLKGVSRCPSSRLVNRSSLAGSRTVRTSSSAEEMAILKAHGAIDHGSGGLIEVVGEPGIGKTRLVDEAVADRDTRAALRL